MLLAGTCYDPAVAVTKSTATLIAMTAFDTTNLRLTFTAPASGRVVVRQQCVIHGATTAPQVLLGVLEGATVLGRVAPRLNAANVAATSLIVALSESVITGLTPGAQLTWDAAYSVKTVVASTGIKYGGPNNTTANNAFGGYGFEIWKA